MQRHSLEPARRIRRALVLAAILGALAALAPPAAAITYASGDVIYVAYRNSPSGAEYVVDLGPVTLFTTATSTFALNDVAASDLNAVVGSSAPNIFVGLFGILDTTNRDALFAARGPVDDFSLLNSSLIGAVNQIDSFGGGLASFGGAVPSGDPHAVGFPGAVTGSYQATLNASSQGSLGANITWSVETRLSSGTGVRNASAVKIRVFASQNNPVAGTHSRQTIGFFTLSPDGTLTYSPDHDGDLIPDDLDLCPGVNNPNNTDADGDLHAAPCDCNDADATAWALPGGPVQSFNSLDPNSTFSWSAPASLGGTAVQYDVYRAISAAMGVFPTAFVCALPNTSVTTYNEATPPAFRQAFIYVVSARNSCGNGPVSMSLGGRTPTVPACP